MNPIFYYLWLPQLTPIVPIIYAGANYQSLDVPLRLFFINLIIAVEVSVGLIVASLMHMNTRWLFSVYPPVELALLMWMFSHWHNNRSLKAITLGSIPLVILIWLFEMTYGNQLFTPTMISGPLADTLLVLSALYIIFKVNRDLEAPAMELPQFWISSGILIFHGGMILISLASSFIFNTHPDAFKSALLIQPALVMISNLLFLGAFRCQKKNSSRSSSSGQVSS